MFRRLIGYLVGFSWARLACSAGVAVVLWASDPSWSRLPVALFCAAVVWVGIGIGASE